MRPELFKAAIMNVPFLDVLTSLLDEELPLTLTDHDEFGNPIKVIYFISLSLCNYFRMKKHMRIFIVIVLMKI